MGSYIVIPVNFMVANFAKPGIRSFGGFILRSFPLFEGHVHWLAISVYSPQESIAFGIIEYLTILL